MLRGEFPSTGLLVGTFLTKAEVLNQHTDEPTGPAGLLAVAGQLPLSGSPTSCARSVLLPSRLASAPFKTVNGNPLCIFKIGEMDHPFATWRTKALPPE